MIHRRMRLVAAAAALAATAAVLPLSTITAGAAATGTIGRLNLATVKAEMAAGLQESTVPAGLTTPRSLKAISVKITGDKKATIAGVCGGTDVTGPATAGCLNNTGLVDPNKLEGADEIVSYDDVTGSVGGLAVIPKSVAASGALEIATAPQTRPYGKGGALGPGGITTTSRTGTVLHSQWVNGVVPGPTCATGASPGDGTALNFNGSTCATPLGTYGEMYAPYASPSMDQVMVGIGDIDLATDGKTMLATNIHDGYLYGGPADGEGALTKVATRPSFASNPTWRPYGLSNFGNVTIVTWTQIGSVDAVTAYAVASYDVLTGVWKNMMSPAVGPLLGKGLDFGYVLSAAEIDTAGKLNVTFLPLLRMGKTVFNFGEGMSAPSIQLPSTGTDTWSNDIDGSPRLKAYSIDNSTNPSFGRMANDQISGRVTVTTIDALHYFSGGFTQYNPDGTSSGTEQLTWRGDGEGGYKVGAAGTVDDALSATDTDLLVHDAASATPFRDVYAFGKMSGMGDIENIANLATIGNRAFADDNKDGIQNTGEASIAGVALEVLDGSGLPIIDPLTGVAAVVITDSDGKWVLTVDGDVKVQVRVAANNWTDGPFAAGGKYAGWNITKQKAGTDTATDSNADPTTRALLDAGGQVFRAGTTDFSFDVGFANVIAPAVPCIKLLTEVQDKNGVWMDANTAAAAAVVANDRTGVVYRFTTSNCGKEDLTGVVISTGVSGSPAINVGILAIGNSSQSAPVTAGRDQLLTGATVTGKGASSGTSVTASDPAQAVPAVIPPIVIDRKLPATGRNHAPLLLLAGALTLLGSLAIGVTRPARTKR